MDSSIIIQLEMSTDFTKEDCKDFQIMRNEEYPTVLKPTTFEHAEKWLKNPNRPNRYITVRDSRTNPPSLVGILVFSEHADYPDSTWFSMVIKREDQRKGIGKKLLDLAKVYSNELRAFSVEHDNYVKKDGSTYFAPLDFYTKYDFFVGEKTLMTERGLECVEIIWKKENS